MLVVMLARCFNRGVNGKEFFSFLLTLCLKHHINITPNTAFEGFSWQGVLIEGLTRGTSFLLVNPLLKTQCLEKPLSKTVSSALR